VERLRFAVAALLLADHGEKMQRVEIFRLELEDVAVNLLGVGEQTAALQRRGALNGLRDRQADRGWWVA
jgi:hypothetical protein